MCGLVGVIGTSTSGGRYYNNAYYNTESTVSKVFKQMLYGDVFRGPHSTGVFTVSSDRTVSTVKKAMPSYDFLEYRPALSLIEGNYDAIIGHNRWATKGGISSETAHPFTHGKITGVHNGTITQHNDLFDDKRTFEVDSEAIFFALSEHSVEEVVSQISGAFALIWFDAETEQLNVIRNDERELSVVYTKTHAFLSSEVKLAEWILDRNDVEILGGHELLVGHHYQFDMKEPTKPRVKKLKLYEPPKSKVITYKTRTTGDSPISRCRKLGYKSGDKVEALATEFKLYSETHVIGSLRGMTIGDPSLPVIIHNVRFDEEVVKQISTVPWFEFTMNSALLVNKELTLSAQANSVKYLEYPSAKEGTEVCCNCGHRFKNKDLIQMDEGYFICDDCNTQVQGETHDQ